MKNYTKISLAIVLMLLLSASTVNAQRGGMYGESFYYEKSAFFIGIGYLNGPSFDDYVNWANQAYADQLGATETMDDFGGSICFSIGLRSRFSRYFGFEVDFMSSSKSTEKAYSNNVDVGGGSVPVELDLNVGAISFSVPIIFHFSDRQPVVPFVAAGATVFPLRLDHRIGYGLRHTKTAFAGNFAAGLDIKVIPRWWITARADWTFGKTNMPISTTNRPLSDDKYELDLTSTFFQIGVMRGIY